MKRWLILLLLSGACFGQCIAITDFAAGTSGSAITTSQLNSSTYGWAGNWSWGSGGTTTPMTYQSNAHGPLNWTGQTTGGPGGSSVCATAASYADSSSVGGSYSTNTIDEGYYTLNLPTNVGTIVQATASNWGWTSLPQTASVNADWGPTLQSGSGYNNLILYGTGSQLELLCETTPVACTEYGPNGSTGTILMPSTTDVTQPQRVWITRNYIVGGNYTGMVWLEDPNHHGSIGRFLGSWTANGTGGAVPTYIYFGDAQAIAATSGYSWNWDHIVSCYSTTTSTACPFPQMPTTPATSSAFFIDPARTTDFTQSGIVGYNSGTLPSSTWTQCGSTLTAGSYSGSTISSDLAACSADTYLLMGAGTFTITGQISFPTSGKVVLRGSGAGSTTLTISGSTSTCNQVAAAICMKSSDGTYTTQPPPNTCTWTAGLAQGNSIVTLSNLAGTCLSGISTTTPTLLWFDSCDTGYSGSPCSGTATDNSQWFVCGATWSSSSGCSQDGPDGGGSRTQRDQLEAHIATAVNTGTGVVNITPPIAGANWASVPNPQVWITQSAQLDGLENLTVNLSGVSEACFDGFNIYHWWISGVACIQANNRAINCLQCAFGIVQNSYVYDTTGTPPSQYGIRLSASSGNLVVNNILQQVLSPIFFDGANTQEVVAYNYCIGTTDPGNTLSPCLTDHAGDYDNLSEGNVANQFSCDDIHGTCDMETLFRNFFMGWDSIPSAPVTTYTNAVENWAYARYTNIAANVLGTPGYHAGYSAQKTNNYVYWVGGGGSNGNGTIPNDSLTKSTSIFWGNYDSYTAAIRWCGNSSDTGWSSTCSSTSEIPTGASTYPSLVPTEGDTGAGQAALPTSLVYTSRPSWWAASIPFPAIGPDVSSGNVLQCGGTLNTSGHYNGVPALATSSQCPTGGTGWAGHVNAIPAMACALQTLSMPPDGTGSAVAFDASSCYSSTPQASPPSCSPGGGTYNNNQSVSCTNPNSGTTVVCYTLTGTTPVTNGLGTGCTTGTQYSSAITINTSETLEAVAGTSTEADSTVSSYSYTLTVANPSCTPGSGTYSGTQSVTCTDSTTSASMYYAINTTATCASTLYTGAISVTTSETVEIIGCLSGYNNSSAVSYVYTITTSTPVAAPLGLIASVFTPKMIALSWEPPPVQQGIKVLAYDIWRGVLPTMPHPTHLGRLPATGCNCWIDSGCTKKKCYYAVSAYDKVGKKEEQSPKSNIVGVSP